MKETSRQLGFVSLGAVWYFSAWLVWHFYEVPNLLLKAWRNFLVFNLEYFSIPVLLKTFFSPWRRYIWRYPRGFDPWTYFETFLSNLLARGIGAICRLVLIFVGIIFEILIAVLGTIIFLTWLLLPFLLLIVLWIAFNLI